MLSLAQKKYLYAIYKLSRCDLPVSTTEVSAMVGVSKASTVKMNRRLVEEGYIAKERYGRISLTEKGETEATAMFSGSNAIYGFLLNALGVDSETAEKESAIIAANLSVDTIERLTNFIQEVR